MPTKPIGPASDTAALVASEALTNASRCVRPTSTPRVAARSAPDAQQVQRRRQHARRSTNAARINGSAARIGPKPPTSRSPISHRAAR